jgi:hypothetical protein
MKETNALRKSKDDCKENRIHNRRGRVENKTNKETKDILRGKVIVRFTKSLLLRWYGHVERTPKQTATATMEGTKEKRTTTQMME